VFSGERAHRCETPQTPKPSGQQAPTVGTARGRFGNRSNERTVIVIVSVILGGRGFRVADVVVIVIDIEYFFGGSAYCSSCCACGGGVIYGTCMVAAAAIDNAIEVVNFFVALHATAAAVAAIIDLVEKDVVGFASRRQHGRPVVAAVAGGVAVGVPEGCVSRPR